MENRLTRPNKVASYPLQLDRSELHNQSEARCSRYRTASLALPHLVCWVVHGHYTATLAPLSPCLLGSWTLQQLSLLFHVVCWVVHGHYGNSRLSSNLFVGWFMDITGTLSSCADIATPRTKFSCAVFLCFDLFFLP